MKTHFLAANNIPGHVLTNTHRCCSPVSQNQRFRFRTHCAVSANEEYVLAIDVGTSGTKAALVSSLGTVVAPFFAPHPTPTSSVEGGQASAEQDPCSWWFATICAVNSCLSKTSSMDNRIEHSLIQALAVTGQMQDVILLPQVGTTHQRQAILYSDARAALEANEVSEMAGGDDFLAHLTGAKQGATSLLAKLRWLDKHDPQAFHECPSVLIGGHDYITWRLCHKCVSDATTASTTGLTDALGQYAESLLENLKLDHWLCKLPPIISTEIPCGEVSKEAAEELGFVSLQGLPVLHCCGDNGACSIGAGAGSPGSLYVYLGTSGWVAGSFPRSWPQLNTKPVIPGVFTLAHPDSSLVFKAGSIMTAGGNLAWAASNLRNPSRSGNFSWEMVNQQAALAPLGSGGLMYLPFLNGERCPFEDPNARAAFIGISSSVSSLDMYRSVMEGVSFALLSASEAMMNSHELGPLRLAGGGARSPLWPVILANVFGQTVDALEDAQNVGVKGAAILAGKWLGWHETLNPNAGWLRVKESFYPCPSSVEKYRDLFDVYKMAYLGLQETFRSLSKYSNMQSFSKSSQE